MELPVIQIFVQGVKNHLKIMKIYKKLIVSAIILLTLPVATMAAENFVVTVINNLLSMVVWPLFLGLVIIMFIWAGILYLTARGDPEKFKRANLAVIFAIIGIIVALLGYRIVATLQQFISSPSSCVQNDNECGSNSDCCSGNCSNNFCAPPPPAPTGACCWGQTCSMTTQADCTGVNKMWQGGPTCQGVVCNVGGG